MPVLSKEQRDEYAELARNDPESFDAWLADLDWGVETLQRKLRSHEIEQRALVSATGVCIVAAMTWGVLELTLDSVPRIVTLIGYAGLAGWFGGWVLIGVALLVGYFLERRSP